MNHQERSVGVLPSSKQLKVKPCGCTHTKTERRVCTRGGQQNKWVPGERGGAAAPSSISTSKVTHRTRDTPKMEAETGLLGRLRTLQHSACLSALNAQLLPIRGHPQSKGCGSMTFNISIIHPGKTLSSRVQPGG